MILWNWAAARNSVATSVLAFYYKDKKINILDTPGHKDFAEDTFRTLTAVDSVIVVIDVAKGGRTDRKLVEVCRMRSIPEDELLSINSTVKVKTHLIYSMKWSKN